MLNIIRKHRKELTNEELGTLVNMSCDVIDGEDVAESEVRIVNYLFKTQFKPSAERYIQTLAKRRKAGKMGGRPRKENKTV